MNGIDKKEIIRNLLQDTLRKDELLFLNKEETVAERMSYQWDTVPDIDQADCPDELNLWNKIKKRTLTKASERKVVFYKIYSLVASVLLIFALGSFVYDHYQKAPVSMFTISSGIQSIQTISLPDGTMVQMGPGSKLTYPELFTGRTRDVSLSGQAFFDIVKNPDKPFIVHTNTVDILALGTAFEVFNYEQESHFETTLLTGKVKITYPSLSDKGTVYLEPDQKMVLDKETNEVKVETVDADKYLSWRNKGLLSFENEKLSMIIPRLEKWFGCNIRYSEATAKSLRFTLKVRTESIEDVLYMISQSSTFRYKEREGVYELY